MHKTVLKSFINFLFGLVSCELGFLIPELPLNFPPNLLYTLYNWSPHIFISDNFLSAKGKPGKLWKKKKLIQSTPFF